MEHPIPFQEPACIIIYRIDYENRALNVRIALIIVYNITVSLLHLGEAATVSYMLCVSLFSPPICNPYKIAHLLLVELLCQRLARIPASEGYRAFYRLLHLPKIACAGSKSARNVRNREQSIPIVRS